MKPVVVLADAARDLELGRDFYDAQQLGIGDYFVDSLLSDLESLRLFHGIHARQFGFHRMLASRFPFGIYYARPSRRCGSLPCWTCGAIRSGFARN